jgi:hypothetical protein
MHKSVLVSQQLNSGLRTCKAEATCPVHFALAILVMGVSQTIYPGCPQMVILWISVSQVARITGVSHRCLALCYTFNQQGSKVGVFTTKPGCCSVI